MAARLRTGLLAAGNRAVGTLRPAAPDRSLKLPALVEEPARLSEPFTPAAWAFIEPSQSVRDIHREAAVRTVQIGHRRNLA